MPTEPVDIPVLIAQTGEQAGERWQLVDDAVHIGRGADCVVLINDKTVSRHHARIERRGEDWYLVDLSKNGTYLNDHAVAEPTRLSDGDVIAIATALKLMFVGSEATVPLTIDIPQGRRLKLDSAARRVWLNGAELEPPLSLPQYRLLELLYEHQGQVCTREDVVTAVWPDAENSGVSEQSIDALVRRLRDRLAEGDADHQYVVTVRGHGFRLDNPMLAINK